MNQETKNDVIQGLRENVERARSLRETVKRAREMLQGGVVDRNKVLLELSEILGVIFQAQSQDATILGLMLDKAGDHDV